MTLKLLFTSALVCALLPAAPSPADKGKEIIDQAVKALGGEAFLNLHTRVTSARVYSFFHDQINGFDVANIYTQYRDESGKGLQVRECEKMGKKQEYSYLFLGNQAYEITFRGARPMGDERMERYTRSTTNDILYILRFHYNQPGMQYDYIGNQVYITNHVEVVDVTPPDGQTIRVYFDFNTKLPVRQSFEWFDNETKQRQDEIAEFDKWRNAGSGIMWPFTIERQRNGYKFYQIFANKVEMNAELPAGIFDLPPGAQLLKRAN